MAHHVDGRCTTLLHGLIIIYQLFFSQLFTGSCRFHPGCSTYAAEALSRHGAFRGGWMALRRLGRCHPWHPGGYDPVVRE